MKILVIYNTDPSHPAITGGAFRLVDILTGWQEQFRPKIFLLDNNLVLKGRLGEEIKNRKLKVSYLLFPYLSWFTYRLRIVYDIVATIYIGLFRLSRPDWIYTDFVPATYIPALIIAKLRRIRLCVVCNLLTLDPAPKQERFLRFTTFLSDLIIVANPAYISLINNKNTFFGNSMVSKKFFHIDRIKKQFDLSFVGSVDTDRKGISVFVKIAKKLSKKAVIVTSTKDLGFLERLLTDKRHDLFTIKRNLSQEEVNKTLNQSKVFLFPTRSESYGLVIGEALKAGAVVITGDIVELGFWRDLAILSSDFLKDTKDVFKNYRRIKKELAKKVIKSDILNLDYKKVSAQEMSLLKKFV